MHELRLHGHLGGFLRLAFNIYLPSQDGMGIMGFPPNSENHICFRIAQSATIFVQYQLKIQYWSYHIEVQPSFRELVITIAM
jgi:hypothetical protein